MTNHLQSWSDRGRDSLKIFGVSILSSEWVNLQTSEQTGHVVY